MGQQNAQPAAGGSPPLAGTDADGAATVDGGLHLPPLDGIAPRASVESTHVDGGVAAHPVRSGPRRPPVAVPLAAGTMTQFAITLPEFPGTLAGTAAGASIQMLVPDASAAAVDSLGARAAAAPSSRGFPGPGLAGAARTSAGAPVVALEAAPVALPDPASVAGAAVLMIGHATLILSNWPAPG